MKNNKNNAELQSRREFFKNAAKSALPILGAIMLTNAPAIMRATEAQCDCSGACMGYCKGTCKGSCDGACMGGCKGTCQSSCSYGCQGSCKGSSSKY
ncbi:MAG: Cys-Xaa-Xaa-Xaa repeat radical SAM target protein [Bacteroidaceae bacterium]|nr:Cys-Xaa-Xaa-Xaa repeat radical SAM target protein [Bacteroidaceae bacterium]